MFITDLKSGKLKKEKDNNDRAVIFFTDLISENEN